MKVSYDPRADAMYIYLSSKKKRVTKTEEMDGWILDYSGKDLSGIEILNASCVFGSNLNLKPTSKYLSSAVAHKIR